MFKKSFAKYGRAITSGDEYKTMYQLYCMGKALLYIFILACAVAVVLTFAWMDFLDVGDNNTYTTVISIIYVFAILIFIFYLPVTIVFNIKIKGILADSNNPLDSSEVKQYKAITKAYYEKSAKLRWTLRIMLILATVFFVVGLIVDYSVNRMNDELGVLGNAAIIVFFAALAIWIITKITVNSIEKSKGTTFEQQTADIARVIDEERGQSFFDNKNNSNSNYNLKYIYPDEDLFEEAKALNAKHNIHTTIGSLIGSVLGLAIGIIFFSPIIFEYNFSAFILPVFVTINTIVSFAFSLPLYPKIKALQERQKRKLIESGQHSKSLDLIVLYDNFNKVAVKFLIGSLIFFIVSSFILAFIFPTQFWCVLPGLPLMVVVAVYIFKLVKLKEKVRQIQNEIEREKQESSVTTQADTSL